MNAAATTEATTTLTWRKIFDLDDTITEGCARYVRLIARTEGTSLDDRKVQELCTECRMQFSEAVQRAFPTAAVSLGGNVIDVPAESADDALRTIRGIANDAFNATYRTAIAIIGGAS